MVAECCSHESGHTVGLSHQSKYDGTCALTATYNDGTGAGEASWAPIMGNSYYRNMSGWNNGPTPYGCANMQDNLSIITSLNGFSYRTDDYSDDINNNPSPVTISGADVAGIIATNSDQDAFSFTLSKNSIAHIEITPFSVDANLQGANLDIKMSLYNSSKILIRTFDPSASMNVVVDTILNSGTYYMLVDGVGNSNIGDYGSLGSYNISSSIGILLPIKNVTLAGRIEKNKHLLNWHITSDEPVKTIVVESSADGINFHPVFTTNGSTTNLSYSPFQNTDLYYRLKAASAENHLVYSNSILLKGVVNTGKPFTVSTFIHDEITVNSSANYQYMVSDANGNTIARGSGLTGYNRVDMKWMPGGMYIMQIISNNEKQTERIIKQ